MTVPHHRLDVDRDPPGAQRRSTVIFGEEGGFAYVTIKTEVTIVLHDPADIDALDLPDLLQASRPPSRLPSRRAGG